MKILTLIFSVSLLANAQSFNGKVFIVTQGQSVIRLPLVEINVYELSTVQKFIKKKILNANSTRNSFSFDSTLIDSLTIIKNNLKSKIQYTADYYGDGNIEHDIYVHKMDSLLTLLRPIEKQLDEDDQRHKAYDNWLVYIRQPEYYFSGLAKPSLKTKSDDQGLFTLNLKVGMNYALAAHSERFNGQTTEEYYWMIKLDKHSKVIILSNDNLFESACDDCLIKLSNLSQ